MTLLWLPLVVYAHVPEVFITNPSEDWCAVIDSVAGGDYVLLEPGDYQGPCDVVSKVSEPRGEVTIVQSLDPTQPARILHDGASPYILSLAGDVGLFLDLDFDEVPEGVVAVQLRDGVNLGVRNGRFSGPGTAVQQLGAIEIVSLRDCLYEGTTGVALDVGCGGDCRPNELEISNNLVDGGTPRFEVWAEDLTLVDNIALQTEGTLFTVDATAGLVSRNGLESTVPLQIAGAVDVQSNVLIGTVDVQGASLLANTVLGAVTGSPAEQADNAVVGSGASAADVTCDASCFVDMDELDLYPAQDESLIGAMTSSVATDWCQRDRLSDPAAGTAGALAFVGAGASPGPLIPDFKSRIDCRVPEVPESVGDPTDSAGGPVRVRGESDGCACAMSEGQRGTSWLGVPWSSFVRRRPAVVR